MGQTANAADERIPAGRQLGRFIESRTSQGTYPKGSSGCHSLACCCPTSERGAQSVRSFCAVAGWGGMLRCVAEIRVRVSRWESRRKWWRGGRRRRGLVLEIDGYGPHANLRNPRPRHRPHDGSRLPRGDRRTRTSRYHHLLDRIRPITPRWWGRVAFRCAVELSLWSLPSGGGGVEHHESSETFFSRDCRNPGDMRIVAEADAGSSTEDSIDSPSAGVPGIILNGQPPGSRALSRNGGSRRWVS